MFNKENFVDVINRIDKILYNVGVTTFIIVSLTIRTAKGLKLFHELLLPFQLVICDKYGLN